MNFQFYVEKLKNSDNFKKFISENKDAFMASGFFIIDKQGNDKPDDKQHFDYFIPSKKKMFSFTLEDGCKMVPVDMVDSSTINKENAISLNSDFDFDFDFNDIEQRIVNEMQIQKIGNKIQKLLLSLQRKNNRNFILATVFISNMGLLKATIDLEGLRIVDFEKKSFMDFLKIGKGKKE